MLVARSTSLRHTSRLHLPLPLLVLHVIFCLACCYRANAAAFIGSLVRNQIQTKQSLPALKAKALSSGSYLSHVMLRVPSVEDTVSFWTEQFGATVVRSTRNPDGTTKSAFVTLGSSTTPAANNTSSFALELVSTPEASFQLGSAISYIGVSMLLPFASSSFPTQDNNGIPLRSVAAAPGDHTARWVLYSNDLDATEAFYTDILGMESKGRDETMLCLRYPLTNESGTRAVGVPTTLVFEKTSVPRADHVVDSGNCLDHLAFAIDKNVVEEHDRVLSADATVKVFLKPTPMFGKMVFGLVDPNGFKVVLAGE